MSTPATFSRRHSLWFSAALLFLAAVVLIWPIGRYPLWGDEAWSMKGSELPLFDGISRFFYQDYHPPLYVLALKAWRNLAGESIFTARMLSVFFVLLTTALICRISADLFRSRKGALAAGAIFVTSDLVLALGSYARQYSLYILLATLSGWLYWRYTQRWQTRQGIAYTLSGIALAYTLYWGPFILLAHGLHSLIYHRRRIKHMALAGLGVGRQDAVVGGGERIRSPAGRGRDHSIWGESRAVREANSRRRPPC